MRGKLSKKRKQDQKKSRKKKRNEKRERNRRNEEWRIFVHNTPSLQIGKGDDG